MFPSLSSDDGDIHKLLKQYTEQFLDSEHEIGYQYPITGAKYTFWKQIFGFLQGATVVDYLHESGRLEFDGKGDCAGTSYCALQEPVHFHLLAIISRNTCFYSKYQLKPSNVSHFDA